MAIKIKVLSSEQQEDFEKEVNEFINKEICKYLNVKTIIDIQYAIKGRCYTAMILYEEEGE